MAARRSLLLGLGALLGVGWLLPLALAPPSRLLLAHVHDHPDSGFGPRVGEVEAIPYYSPFERKLRCNGFQFDLDSLSLIKDLTTFQDVCDLLGCKVDDFEPPNCSELVHLLDYHPLGAHILRRKEFTCHVWVYELDWRKDKDKLRKSGVHVSVWIHR